jgi:hypothetical protein
MMKDRKEETLQREREKKEKRTRKNVAKGRRNKYGYSQFTTGIRLRHVS